MEGIAKEVGEVVANKHCFQLDVVEIDQNYHRRFDWQLVFGQLSWHGCHIVRVVLRQVSKWQDLYFRQVGSKWAGSWVGQDVSPIARPLHSVHCHKTMMCVSSPSPLCCLLQQVHWGETHVRDGTLLEFPVKWCVYICIISEVTPFSAPRLPNLHDLLPRTRVSWPETESGGGSSALATCTSSPQKSQPCGTSSGLEQRRSSGYVGQVLSGILLPYCAYLWCWKTFCPPPE